MYGVDAGQAVVRQQLPAGPPAGRARRPLRAALSHRLGPSRQPRHRTSASRSTTAAAKSISPSAALVKDLKQRGLLDDTLVVWGGEFGRTPQGEPRDIIGRDHHIDAYTMWLAGGGIKRGHTVGKTDELGYYAVEDQVHVHDLQATILHLLGLDHLKLTYRFQGRDFRLTDVARQRGARSCWRDSVSFELRW